MSFQLLDARRYPLKVETIKKDLLPYWRWEHRGTIGHDARVFMVFADTLNGNIHIEEIAGGHLETVKDDQLFEALKRYAIEKGLLEVKVPIFKPDHERFI